MVVLKVGDQQIIAASVLLTEVCPNWLIHRSWVFDFWSYIPTLPFPNTINPGFLLRDLNGYLEVDYGELLPVSVNDNVIRFKVKVSDIC